MAKVKVKRKGKREGAKAKAKRLHPKTKRARTARVKVLEVRKSKVKAKVKAGVLAKSVKSSKKVKKTIVIKEKEKTLETYELEADNVKINVSIEKSVGGLLYKITIPEFSLVTKALINEIRNELVSEVVVSGTEILEPTALESLKKRFREKAEQILDEKVPGISKTTKNLIIGRMMQEMLGLDKIEFLLNDPELEEVVITSVKEPIRVYHKKYGWIDANVKPRSEEEIINFSNIIARRVGRQISTLTPLLDAHLITGDRANAILYPISTKGNTITIRKFRRDPWTVTDLIENGTCSVDVFAALWLAIEYEMNILFSGGTASGKTTFLNVCMPFIPPNHRLVSIEDTRELNLPATLYWEPLVTRQPNPEGKGEVTMLDLLVNALRMRPDRIIVGEIRRQREAEVLFEAMHTGHSVYATVHADTTSETISRLTHPPISVPTNLLKAVNLNVVLFRDRRKGIRRVSQVAEFIVEEDRVTPNIIFRYKPTEDKIVEHAKSIQFIDDIGRYTGMSINDINKELADRKKILSWFVKNKIRTTEDISKVMKLYYSDKEELLRAVNKNEKLQSLFKS